MKKLVTQSVAVLALATGIGAAVATQPAHADTDLPGGGMCSKFVTFSKPTSTSVKATYKVSCGSTYVAGIQIGATLSRPGKTITGSKNCWSTTSCTMTLTISNPSGTQTFTGVNEWAIANTSGSVTSSGNRVVTYKA